MQAQIRRDRLPAQLVPRQSERQVDRLLGRDGRGHRQGDGRRSRAGRDDVGELRPRLSIQQDRLAVRAGPRKSLRRERFIIIRPATM